MSTEEKKGLRRQLSQESTSLAMQGRWQEAIVLNRRILEDFPNDVETHNRLGRALIEVGELAQAKDAYSQALNIDPYNIIARKNLSRLASFPKSDKKAKMPSSHSQIAPHLFVTEMGKSRIVNLELLAPREIVAQMAVGDPVHLKARTGNLIAENVQNEYLGEVEPKYGLRLAKLAEGGNKYTAAIASLGDGKAKIIIRETYQHPSQQGKPSFPIRIPTGVQHHPYIRDTLIRQDFEEEVSFASDEGETIPEGFSIIEEATAEAEDYKLEEE